MKAIVAILAVCGIFGIVAAAVDVQQIHIVGSVVNVTHYSLLGRVAAFAISAVLLIAAYGCNARTAFGWYLVNAMLWVSMLWAAIRAVYLAVSLDLPFPGVVLGGLGEVVKIGVWVWIIFVFWAKRRREFRLPNQSSEPTPASVTPPAEQESRPRWDGSP